MNKSPERKDNKIKKEKEKPHAKEQAKKENEPTNSPKTDKEKHDKSKGRIILIKSKKGNPKNAGRGKASNSSSE